MNFIALPGQTPDGKIAAAQKDEEIRVLRQQNAVLMSLAQSAKIATENAQKAAESSDKAAKRALIAAWVSGAATIVSAVASVLVIFL